MRSPLHRCTALLLALAAGCARNAPVQSPPVPAGFAQLIVVRSDGWDTPRAHLQRYARTPQGWQAVGEPIHVVIGYAGYGWGRGLHGDGRPAGEPGPVKREGDGRSPAGVFALGTTYGYADTSPSPALRYQRSADDLRCVDDPASAFYNRIVSAEAEGRDWRSAETMRRTDPLYELAITVRHNLPTPEEGAGSCIFLHVWESPDTFVRGCTAMAWDDLKELAQWLRPDSAAMVALPEGEYVRLRGRWRLP